MPNRLPRSCNRNSTTGIIGVSFNPGSQKWQAQFTFNKVHYYIGLYSHPLEAKNARNRFERRLRSAYSKQAA